MPWLYAILSVLFVSFVSFVGLFTLSIKIEKLKSIVFAFVSFAAGGMLGDVFLHLLPHMAEEGNFGLRASLSVLGGIMLMFLLEKVVHWRHCHHPTTKEHVHSFAVMNLIGDGVHNCIDGIIIGASYLVSIPVGISTTLAVVLHEIPQEIGDFSVLIHGGFTRWKALLFNFVSALTAILGAFIGIGLGGMYEHATDILIPFAAGSFIYIAGSDLIPEMHKEQSYKKSLIQLGMFCIGVGIMVITTLFE